MEEPGYIEVLQLRVGSQEPQRLLLIKKTKQNRYLEIRNLVLFYIREDAKVWAH